MNFKLVILFLLVNLNLSVFANQLSPNLDSALLKIQSKTSLKSVTNSLDSLLNKNKGSLKNQVKILSSSIPFYIKKHKYDNAMQYVHKGIDITLNKNLDSAHAFFLKQKGVVEYYATNVEAAIESFKSAAKYAQSKNITTIEASCYNNLGGLLVDLKEFDDAERYLKLSIKLNNQLGNNKTKEILMTKRLLATLYFRTGKNEKAIELFNIITKQAYELKDTVLICANLVYSSEQYSQIGLKEEALKNTTEALRLMRQLHDDHSLFAVMTMHSKHLMDLGKFKESNEISREMLGMQKSIYVKETQKQLNDLEVQYKVNEIEQEKNIANSKAENEKQKNQLLIISLVGTILIAFLIYLVIYNHNKKKKSQLQIEAQKQLVQAIFDTEEKEKTRIAKELHDGIVQELTVLKLELNNIDLASFPEKENQLQFLGERLTNSTKELREISYQMMPVTLRELGLIKGLEELMNRSISLYDIQFEMDFYDETIRLSDKIEISVYRICQELLNNALKHSQASLISLSLRIQNNTLFLIFEDNGKGFNLQAVKKGIGLSSLNSRIEMTEGTIEINTSESTGTVAFIKIPLN